MNIRRTSLFCIIGIMVFLSGCTSFEPPERPVAYVFPTIRDMSSLDDVEERDVTEAQVRDWMARAAVYDELRASGMTDADWQLLVRGLRRGGYAELDVRKAALAFRWITVSCLKKGGTEIMVGYDQDRGEGMHAGMVLQDRILDETISRCRMPGMTISSAWYGKAGGTERELVILKSAQTGQNAFWLKRLVFEH